MALISCFDQMTSSVFRHFIMRWNLRFTSDQVHHSALEHKICIGRDGEDFPDPGAEVMPSLGPPAVSLPFQLNLTRDGWEAFKTAVDAAWRDYDARTKEVAL